MSITRFKWVLNFISDANVFMYHLWIYSWFSIKLVSYGLRVIWVHNMTSRLYGHYALDHGAHLLYNSAVTISQVQACKYSAEFISMLLESECIFWWISFSSFNTIFYVCSMIQKQYIINNNDLYFCLIIWKWHIYLIFNAKNFLY